MDLSTLKNLGLPEWLIILAVLVFILKQVGALNFIYSRLVDTSEHKQQSEDRQTDHLQKSQTDTLASHLSLTDRAFNHIMETSNGRMKAIEERLGQVIGILRNIEGQQTITNRDWSRMEEILADIDAAMHEIKTSVRIDVNPKTR